MRTGCRLLAGVILTGWSLATAQSDFFPMFGTSATVWWDTGISYIPDAQLMGANLVTVELPTDYRRTLDTVRWFSRLREAGNSGMKIIIGNARIDFAGKDWDMNISRFAAGQYVRHEAESLCRPGDIGRSEPDPFAGNGRAWCVTRNQGRGSFQTRARDDDFRFDWSREDSGLRYTAYYRLRASGLQGTLSLPVCSLWITVPGFGRSDSLVVSRRLTSQDFPRGDTYYQFGLTFHKPGPGSATPYRFGITYLGVAETLWSDEVEFCDLYADSLVRLLPDGSEPPYARKVRAIARFYNNHPGFGSSIFRYWLVHEPPPRHWKCCAVIQQILEQEDPEKTGITWVNWWDSDPDRFARWISSIRPKELWVDVYPLMGRTWPSQQTEPPVQGSQRTPVDAGDGLQRQLDYFCMVLENARSACQQHQPPIPFWVDVQAFGEYLCRPQRPDFPYNHEWDTVSEPPTPPRADEGIWREPSARELNCMFWLALAHGAKGLSCWLFLTRYEYWQPGNKYLYLLGALKWAGDDSTGKPQAGGYRPVFYRIQTFFDRSLKRLAPTLLRLASTAVGRGRAGFVRRSSDSLLHIGTFAGPEHDYLIVVNRRCRPSDSIQPTVTVEWRPGVPPVLIDELTGELIYGTPGRQGGLNFIIPLLPGEGRLLRLGY